MILNDFENNLKTHFIYFGKQLKDTLKHLSRHKLLFFYNKLKIITIHYICHKQYLK